MALTVSECHFGSLAHSFRPQAVDRLAHALGEAVMTGEDVVEAFRLQQVERGAQAAQQLRCRRVGEVAEVVGA